MKGCKMFWEEDKKQKPSPQKYAHKHEVIIADENEYQAKNFLSEMPQLHWVIEKTFGGKNKYIIQSDSKSHIDFFLHIMKEYIAKKDELCKLDHINKEEKSLNVFAKGTEGEICLGSLEHIRFKHIDGHWYGDV
jgi:hypothetical protein